MQTTKYVFLVRPARFNYNSTTAANNAFQNEIGLSDETVNQNALQEFDAFAAKLKLHGVNVLVFDDAPYPPKPDAVFPNNWVSLHGDGTVVLYPLFAPNRQQERSRDMVESLKKYFSVKEIIDLSGYEKENKFLEGTGSVVFDHVNKIAYACLSPRTNPELFNHLCERLRYRPVHFQAHDQRGKEIYHTNVMMCIADEFAVVCLESIPENKERDLVSHSLTQTGHEIIEISFQQMNDFAGNMLALQTNDNHNILALSQRSFDCLSYAQKQQLEKYGDVVPLSIPTIETIGGGSARCMIAEIFLPLAN